MDDVRAELLCCIQSADEKIKVNVFRGWAKGGAFYGVEQATRLFPNNWRGPNGNLEYELFFEYDSLMEHLCNTFDFEVNHGFSAIYLSGAFEGEERTIHRFFSKDKSGYTLDAGSCFGAMFGQNEDIEDYEIKKSIMTIDWQRELRVSENPLVWADFNHVWAINRFGEYVVESLGEDAQLVYWQDFYLERFKERIFPKSLPSKFIELYLDKHKLRIGLDKKGENFEKIIDCLDMTPFEPDDDFTEGSANAAVLVCSVDKQHDSDHRFYDSEDFAGQTMELYLASVEELYQSIGRDFFNNRPETPITATKLFSCRAQAEVYMNILMLELEPSAKRINP